MVSITRCDSHDMFIQTLKAELAKSGSDLRVDSGEFAGFSRAAEFFYSQTYDAIYPQYKGRQLLPLNTSVPAGAEFHTWRQFDRAGEAMIVRDYSRDFPSVDLSGQEFRNNIVSLGASYHYGMQEMRTAAMYGLPIEAKKALMTRQVMEMKVRHAHRFNRIVPLSPKCLLPQVLPCTSSE